MSFPVLSELFLKFLFLETEEERDTLKELMDHLRTRRKTEFYCPKRIGKLMEDLDKNLIDHKSVRERYGLKICHPKSFI